MSSPMFDLPDHLPIEINADGRGPETDPEKVDRTVCWSCWPPEDWPCKAMTTVYKVIMNGHVWDYSTHRSDTERWKAKILSEEPEAEVEIAESTYEQMMIWKSR